MKKTQKYQLGKLKYILLVLVGLSFIFLNSCRKDELDTDKNELGYQYLPLSVGNTWTYSFDSIEHDPYQKKTTVYHYLEKDVVVNEFTGSNGETFFEINRLRYDTAGSRWNITTNYTLSIENFKAVIADSSSKRIILVFPIAQFSFWDGNVLNNIGPQEFEVQYVGQNLQLDSLVFDSTCKVVQEDFRDVLSLKHFYKECVYAKNIGLVSKTIIHTTRTNKKQVVPKGYELNYRLISYEIK